MSVFTNNRVSLMHHQSYDLKSLRVALELLLEPFGGWNGVLREGDRVILKPNLVTAAPREKNVTTDPALVEAVILACHDCGCEVRVADASVFGSAASVARQSGLLDVCRKHGVELQTLGNSVKRSFHGRSWGISADLSWATKLINLPKLKGHSQLYYTGAVKNLFGCVVGRRKFVHHMWIGDKHDNFGEMLLDIAALACPALSILDGIGAMAGGGPVNGTPVELGLLGAAQDPLALDWAVVELLGGEKEKIPYFRAAKKQDIWSRACCPEVQWCGTSFEPRGFFFPATMSPVRFNPRHAVRSVMKTTLLRIRGER